MERQLGAFGGDVTPQRLRRDELAAHQTTAAEGADDAPHGRVGDPGHWGKHQRRVDDEVGDLQHG